jgi:hypothetical protein
MPLTRKSLVLAASALVGAALGAALPLEARSALAGDLNKDLKDAEALKKKRDTFREKLKKEGKFPFFDLTHAADQKVAQETRWSSDDMKSDKALEEPGPQLHAVWSASTTQQGGIDVMIHKFLHNSLDGKSEYTYTFEKAGKKAKTNDKKGIAEGFYLEWMKELKDPVPTKCKEPKKTTVGPAELYATVVGTDPASQRRVRWDLYIWTGPNTTYFTKVEIGDKYLDDPDIMKKAEDFIGSIKEIKNAPK